METTRNAFTKAVSVIDTQIDQEARHKYVYDVQRENLDLQLEARWDPISNSLSHTLAWDRSSSWNWPHGSYMRFLSGTARYL